MHNNTDWDKGYGHILKPDPNDFNKLCFVTDDHLTVSLSDNISTAQELCDFLSNMTYFDSDTNEPIEEQSQIERHLEGKYYCKISPELMLEIIKSIHKISRGY
jgi:hypothetical protein